MKIIGKITPPKGPKILGILQTNSENLDDPLNDIKNLMLSSIQNNFDDEGRPEKWKDLADSTKKARARKKKWPGQILSVSGQLSSSINGQVDGNSVLVGSALKFPNSNKPFIRIHDLGGKAGRGGSVLIPKREILLFQDEDITEAEDILAEHLLRGSK